MSFWKEFTKSELEFIPIKNLTNPLGLIREPWKFSRGAKTERIYTKDGTTYIKVVYQYTYPGNDLRNIESYSEKIYLLESDGSVFHEMVVPVSLNTKNIKEINRAIRFGRIDFMDATGEQLIEAGNALPTPVDQATVDYLISQGSIHPDYNTPELYESFRQNLITLGADIENIFNHYSNEIYEYKDRGTETFYTSVQNEVDQNIIDILNKKLPPDEVFTAGFKILEAIEYQLRGVLPV